MERVVMIGGRGTAVVVAEQLLDAIERHGAPFEFLGYAFDDETLGPEIDGFPILCKTYEAYEKYRRMPEVKFLYQLYRPDLMKERVGLFQSFQIPQDRMFTLIHPNSYVARSAKVGPGTVVCSFAVVNPNSNTGANSSILTGALVGHDTQLGDHSFLAAQTCIGSNVRMGIGNFIGLNATIRNFVSCGDFSIIGANSNVVKNVDNEQVLYGNPAKVRTGLGGPIR
jgi:acetyltransferase EpsM